ncbi:MAG: hypothetical protein Q8N65_01545 [bacterium]|nr:hypothetical protein [bacterium]
MKFVCQKPRDNITNIGRSIGYRFLGTTADDEFNLVRPLGRDYPRFHLYLKEETERTLLFSLHLDQKKPSYGRETAHSGEYDGELVEAERQRIEQILII